MSNRVLVWRWLAALAVMLLATACMQNLFDLRSGKVSVEVAWPARSAYHVAAIPAGTARVRVTIDGEGLEGQPRAAEVVPDGTASTSSEILEVPVGPKVVQAYALDALGKQLAYGQVAINVAPNKINPARIVLAPIDAAASGETPVSPDPNATGEAPASRPAYVIDTVAGEGIAGANDGGDPRAARFKGPSGLVFAPRENALYVADTDNKLIRRFDLTTLAVTTVAGQASSAAVPTPDATTAPALLGSTVGTPAGLAIDPQGAVYFADREHHLIRKLKAGGGVVTVVGSGEAGATDSPTALKASFDYPVAVAFDRFGTMYVADHLNHKIRRVSPTGTVTTLAGTGAAAHTGDGGLATEAALQFPTAIAVDPAGEFLYFAEGRDPTVRRVNLLNGIITTVAGTGRFGTGGEGGPALRASMALPTSLAFAAGGELLIGEGWAFRGGPDALVGMTSRVLMLDGQGNLVRLAGRNARAYGFGGDGGDARVADLNNPLGLAIDARGWLYVADAYNHRIRVIKPGKAAPAPVPTPTPTPSATPTPTPSPSAAANG